MQKITRKQMIRDLDELTDRKSANLKGKKGFARDGAKRRLEIQTALYNRLIDGGHASAHEVAGIYGRGSRMDG